MTPKTSNGNTKLLYVIIAILISVLGATLGWGIDAVGTRLEKVDQMAIDIAGMEKDIEYIKEQVEGSVSQVGDVADRMNEVEKRIEVHETKYP